MVDEVVSYSQVESELPAAKKQKPAFAKAHPLAMSHNTGRTDQGTVRKGMGNPRRGLRIEVVKVIGLALGGILLLSG